MKQEEILIENKTENTALEAQMSETIGITGGIASILTGTTGQFETLGSICAGVMENTSSIFSIGQMSNASLATIAEGSGSSISLLGQMTDGVTQLVIASDKLCDGVLKLVENTTQNGALGTASALGSVASGVSGVVQMGSSVSAGVDKVKDVMGLIGGLFSSFTPGIGTGLIIIGGIVVAITTIRELLLWWFNRKDQKEAEEAARKEAERQQYGAADPNAYLEKYGDSMGAQPQAAAPSGDGGASQVGNLSQTMTSGMIQVQEATLQNLSLVPEIVNLTLDTLNVIVQGTSSFVFQQGVNFGLAGLEPKYSPVWGEPAAARPGTGPVLREPSLLDRCRTFREIEHEAGLAGQTRPQASVENNSSTSNAGSSNSESSVTSEWGAQNYHTFAPVFHMYGLTIKHESDFEEVAAFESVPNEGARYGKLGPTKIRAEPETKIKRGNMKSKSKSRSRFN